MDFSTINISAIKKNFISVARVASFAFGVLCLIGGVIPLVFYLHLNPGNIALIVYGTLVFVVLFLHQDSFSKEIHRKIVVVIKRILTAFLIACFVTGAVISVFMVKYAFFNQPDDKRASNGTVVVLGCKINGEQPSIALQGRLEAAYDYLSENEEAVAVVSGGQGWDEVVSEAYVMKKYLVDKGISADRIYMEDKAVNTEENIRFSGEIIKENNLQEVMYIITDTFHSCRAYMFAKHNGYEAKNISASIYWPLIGEYWVRDILGIIHMTFTPNWKLELNDI